MAIGQNRVSLGLGPRSFWRRLVGTALIYALIMQQLMLAVAGVQPGAASSIGASAIDASAINDISLSQLCLHATDGDPVSPTGEHKHPADDHCASCFAGAFHLLDAPRPVIVRYVSSEIGKVRRSVHPIRLSSFLRYSVARPRGPPLST
jgi:hypothetical protein